MPDHGLGAAVTRENSHGDATDGECPTESAIARCVPRFGSDKVTFYYRNPDADNEQAMNSMENLCTGEFTRF